MNSSFADLRSRFRQPIRFVIVGAINTLVGLGVIYGCKYFAGFGDLPANIVGYAIGLTVSFFLNSSWTFAYRGPRLPAAARFLAVFAVSYLANLATVMGLIHIAGVNGYLAQAAGTPIYTVCFYLLSRFYAFRAPPRADR